MKRARKIENQKRKLYDPSVLDLALNQARKTGVRLQGIIMSPTAWQRYLRKPPRTNKPGPNTIIHPEEESKIEEGILYMDSPSAKAGSLVQLRDMPKRYENARIASVVSD